MELPVLYDSLSIEEKKIVREEYVRRQNNRCFFCGNSLLSSQPDDERINWEMFPGGKEGFLKYPVHLQHDHRTGMTEGAVHSICNALYWCLYGR